VADSQATPQLFDDVRTGAAYTGRLEELPALADAWMTTGGQTALSRETAGLTLRRFVRFARAHRVTAVGVVTDELVADFVSAPNVNGDPPAVSTQYQRRSSLRMAFLIASLCDRSIADPTRHLVLPSRSTMAARPLTDDELVLLRQVSLATVVETRRPAIVALAESGAVSTEISLVAVEDIDLQAGLVRLSGCNTASPRVARLTDWGKTQLTRRLQRAGTVPGQGVAYRGTGGGTAPHTSVSTTMRRLFDTAGLSTEPDVKLGSVRAWAGRKAFDETGCIDAVARVLGCNSLDVAARLIGWDWAERSK
jgi:integrase/recombinase XerC